jgi:tRNA threonylcarbamoyladenosine biosynthesis protein TsaE
MNPAGPIDPTFDAASGAEPPIELVAPSERDTITIGECIGSLLAATDADRAVVLAIEGDLGAGKTRFVRGLAAGLALDPDAVASPTFVVSVEHPAPANRSDARSLVHIDAWRIRSVDELESIGWDELCARPRTVIAVEWASKIAAALPSERIDVAIEHLDDARRRIVIVDRRADGLARARLATQCRLFEPRGVGRTASRRCPICAAFLEQATAPVPPFCSDRCRDADLNRWFTGRYTVSRPIDERDDEEV